MLIKCYIVVVNRWKTRVEIAEMAKTNQHVNVFSEFLENSAASNRGIIR